MLVSFRDYLYLAPVLCMLGGGLVSLLLDLLVPRERVARWAWWMVLFTGTLALGATFLVNPEPVRLLVVLSHDGFAAYTWRLLLGALMLITLLSESYVRRRTQEPGLFYAFLMFFALGALLVAAASNTIMLLVALDLLSIAGYVLTGFLRNDRRAAEAALKTLIYGAALSAVMALGLSWLYGLTGTTDYTLTQAALSRLWSGTSTWLVRPAALYPILVFVLVGLCFKIGAAPFHPWLSDTFEGAPAPVAASLAVLPRVAGLAALVRVTMVMLPAGAGLPAEQALGHIWRWPLVGSLAIVAMVAGNLLGLGQANIKRLMAYSGLAQVGVALIAVAVASEASLSALLVYLTAYTLAELGAFASIAAVSEQGDAETLTGYRGLYRRAPLLAAALMVGMLSLFGMPGTAGFMAKLALFTATYRSGHYVLLSIAALGSVVSLAYYWKVIRAVFVHGDGGLPPVRVPAATVVVVVVVVAGVLLVGVLPHALVDWTTAAVQVFFVAR